MRYTILILIIIFGFAGSVKSQYQVPLYAPGNSGGISLGNNKSVLSVTGQNVIGVSENDSYKAYLGLLAPFTLATGINQPESLKNASLGQNYPNPFRHLTTIPFEIEKKEKVVLRINNVSGQPVKVLLDQAMPAGNHLIRFNADRLTPGIFFYQLEVEGKVLVKSMVLTK